MKKFTINLSNIHCDKCEVAIRKCLQQFYKISDLDEPQTLTNRSEIIFKLVDNEVILYGNENIDFQLNIKRIIKLLEKIGFEVLSWELKYDDETISSSQMTTIDLEEQHEPDGFSILLDSTISLFTKDTRRTTCIIVNLVKIMRKEA